MPTLYDADGNPIDKTRLVEEVAAPTVTGVRQILSGHPAQNLSPRRLAALLLAAEQGDAVAYLELAEEMEEKDLHYRSVLSTRKLQVSGLPVTVEAASDAAEDVKAADLVRDFLSTGVLANAMQDILDAVGKGFSACEILWDTEGKAWYPSSILWRDPRWFEFDRLDGVTLRLKGENGLPEPLAPAKFITHVHKSKSGLPIRGGLARPVAWYYLFKNFGINLSMTLDPYRLTPDGKRYNKLFFPGRIVSTGWSFGYTFKSREDRSQSAINDITSIPPEYMNPYYDPYGNMDPVLRRQYMSQMYYDFSLPWNFGFNYAINYNISTGNYPPKGYKKNVTQTVSFNGSLTITPKTGITFQGGYDIKANKLTTSSISISRDLHCWQMSFSWIPFGFHRSWSFNIGVKAASLSDLKYDKSQSMYDNMY